jgi:hypothetical protein
MNHLGLFAKLLLAMDKVLEELPLLALAGELILKGYLTT